MVRPIHLFFEHLTGKAYTHQRKTQSYEDYQWQYSLFLMNTLYLNKICAVVNTTFFRPTIWIIAAYYSMKHLSLIKQSYDIYDYFTSRFFKEGSRSPFTLLCPFPWSQKDLHVYYFFSTPLYELPSLASDLVDTIKTKIDIY